MSKSPLMAAIQMMVVLGIIGGFLLLLQTTEITSTGMLAASLLGGFFGLAFLFAFASDVAGDGSTDDSDTS